ncbi:MAG: hypothetical protein M3R50_06930 [Bacteroidota bacterium]|nr:hypothetical protein [Bacteroidota bacterium]
MHKLEKRLAVTGSNYNLPGILSRRANIFILIFASLYVTSCIGMFFSQKTNLWFYSYRNGFALKSFDDLPASWKQFFVIPQIAEQQT